MNDDLARNGSTLDAPLPSFMRGIPALPRSPGASGMARASIFKLYPRGSRFEVLGALRYLMGVEGTTAASLEARAGLDPGAVNAFLFGKDRPCDEVVGRLCRSVGISRWLFFLIGSIQYGADLGVPELQWMIEKRRRMLAKNTDESLEELVAEATRFFFNLGGRQL